MVHLDLLNNWNKLDKVDSMAVTHPIFWFADRKMLTSSFFSCYVMHNNIAAFIFECCLRVAVHAAV